jgi:hypothetical protein
LKFVCLYLKKKKHSKNIHVILYPFLLFNKNTTSRKYTCSSSSYVAKFSCILETTCLHIPA